MAYSPQLPPSQVVGAVDNGDPSSSTINEEEQGNDAQSHVSSGPFSRLQVPTRPQGIIVYYDGSFFPAHPGHAAVGAAAWNYLVECARERPLEPEPLGVFFVPLSYDYIRSKMRRKREENDLISREHQVRILQMVADASPCPAMVYEHNSAQVEALPMDGGGKAALESFYKHASSTFSNIQLSVAFVTGIDGGWSPKFFSKMKQEMPYVRVLCVNNRSDCSEYRAQAARARKANIEVIDALQEDYSSTDVRDAARNGGSMEAVYPAGYERISDYIREHGLWQH